MPVQWLVELGKVRQAGLDNVQDIPERKQTLLTVQHDRHKPFPRPFTRFLILMQCGNITQQACALAVCSCIQGSLV